MMLHLLITGARQRGKSTLANRYLTARGLSYAGYRTKVREQTEVGPVYEMQDLRTGECRPISRREGDRMVGIPKTFDSFGTKVIRDASASDAPILLLDEIGRFERSSGRFLAAIDEAFSEVQQVVAVLKQEELPYLESMKVRTDVCLVDLDVLTREEAWERIQEVFLK